MCLRCRGTESPKLLATECFDEAGCLNPQLKENMINDKLIYCKLCNWPCVMMSNMIGDSPEMFGTKQRKVAELIHKEKRNK
jgi:hypothetical protein